MPDELKTDAETALADSTKVIKDLSSAETTASGWVKTHTAWAIGLGAFIAGWATRFIHL